MKTKLFACFAVASCFLLVSCPIYAHHSMSIYDMSQTITLKATVADFDWSNPHVQIHFEVKDEKGNMEKWLAECASPSKLSRMGWTKDSLKPQEEITVTGNPTKDGSKSVRLGSVILSGGQQLVGRIH
jgi:uncharacterized protein DUF6152